MSTTSLVTEKNDLKSDSPAKLYVFFVKEGGENWDWIDLVFPNDEIPNMDYCYGSIIKRGKKELFTLMLYQPHITDILLSDVSNYEEMLDNLAEGNCYEEDYPQTTELPTIIKAGGKWLCAGAKTFEIVEMRVTSREEVFSFILENQHFAWKNQSHPK